MAQGLLSVPMIQLLCCPLSPLRPNMHHLRRRPDQDFYRFVPELILTESR
ncbi:MAG: hypothetical protein QG577_1253 [Thermodesulfobacteriota bacterium]|nr:hypothetical protein [Thermodesulfobacteriota bacterium]